MIIDWNVDDIKREIDKIAINESDSRMDGFVTWRCKQDLYKVLWYVEDKLDKCSTYSDEEKFIETHKIDMMWDILKDD